MGCRPQLTQYIVFSKKCYIISINSRNKTTLTDLRQYKLIIKNVKLYSYLG